MATASNISKVNTLAAQIRRNDSTKTRSSSMKIAWMIISKGDADYKLLIFKKKSTGKITRRVVSEDWAFYQTPKGGKSNIKPGQKVFADLGKYIAGCPNCLISAYTDSIQFYA